MEFIFAFLYLFHQLISSNLDLFYFFTIICIGRDLFNGKITALVSVKYVYVIIIYGLLQILIIEDINISRLLINLAKLYLNIYLFLSIKEKWFSEQSFKKFIYACSIQYLILLPVSFLYKTPILWRFGDKINFYHQTRLQLFYYEPSELSFHVCLIIIVLLYFLFKEKENKAKLKNMFFIIANFLIVFFSAGAGGMACIALAITVMYVFYLKSNHNIKNVFISICFLLTSMLITAFLVASNNSYYLRLLDVINGHDSSVNYRANVCYQVMKQILINTNWIGAGFGNLNTPAIRDHYISIGFVDVISNSFMYYIAEGGIVAIISLLIFIIMLIRHIHNNEYMLKYPMFIFIFTYQIIGGYFTNPINWIIYGLICNVVFLKEASYSLKKPKIGAFYLLPVYTKTSRESYDVVQVK